MLFSSYIFIVSRIDLTEQSQAMGETECFSQQWARAAGWNGSAHLPGASPAECRLTLGGRAVQAHADQSFLVVLVCLEPPKEQGRLRSH